MRDSWCQSESFESSQVERSHDRFLDKVWLIVRIATAIILLGFVLSVSLDLLLIVFAGILFGTVLGSLAKKLTQLLHKKVSYGKSLALVVVVMMAVLIGTVSLLGPAVSEQLRSLQQSLPASIDELHQKVGQLPYGEQLLRTLPHMEELGGRAQNLVGGVASALTGTIGALTTVLLIAVIALYLAAEPQLYIRGSVRLLPRKYRDRALEVFHEVGLSLNLWMAGRVVDMAIVAVLTGAGLWLLGVPLALTFGLLAGILSFIPNIGPILAAIPPVLLALTLGPRQALWVVILLVAIQTIESYLLLPLIQKRSVALPPALLLSAQLFFGTVLGFLGLVFATPLIVALMVILRMVYCHDVLGNSIELPTHKQEGGRRPAQESNVFDGAA